MKRAKKILLWTGIGLGTLIAILLICAACYSWILGSRLEKRLAAIKAAGDPICLADFARKPVAPEENGAIYLRRAKDDLEAVDKACMDLKFNDKEDRYYAEEIPRIEAALNAYPNIYPLLEKTAAATDLDFQTDTTQTPSNFLNQSMNNATLFRSTARYLDEQVEVLLSKGDRDKAVQSAILLLQLTRQFEREPPLLNTFFISIAMKHIACKEINWALQAGPVSDQTRKALAAELSLHNSIDAFQKSLKSERAFSLDRFRYEMPHPWLLSNIWQLSVLDVFDEYLNYILHPYSYWAAKEDIKQTKPKSVINVLTELLRPAFKSAMISAYRSQALVRAVRIINALQKKSPIDSDKIPTMMELGLPDEVGIDPFNGKPMIIKKLPGGWLVYSVGENLKDDGGKVEEVSDNKPLDIGFGPKTAKPQSQEKEPAQ